MSVIPEAATVELNDRDHVELGFLCWVILAVPFRVIGGVIFGGFPPGCPPFLPEGPVFASGGAGVVVVVACGVSEVGLVPVSSFP